MTLTIEGDLATPVSQARPAVELDGVQVRFGSDGPPALEIDHLSFAPGEKIAVIGPSGAGKTTLLRVINGLTRPDAGTVRVLGVNMAGEAARAPEFRRRIGFVAQGFNLVERASVFENVLWGRLGWMNPISSLFGWYSDTDRELALKAVHETGLGKQRDQRADTLSGGQQQRVAVARALAQNPDMITADEPVSNLDPVRSADILRLLVEASTRRAASLVMVVHHPALAERHVDRIIGLNDGRIVCDRRAGGRALDAETLERVYGPGAALATFPLSPRDDERPPPRDGRDDHSADARRRA